MRAGIWGRGPACGGRWRAEGCCSQWDIRPSAASSPRRAERCSSTRRHGETGSGRPTSPNFETAAQGTWQLGVVVDYVSKLVLACPVTATQTATDLLAALDAAAHTAQTLLGHPLIEDCVDAVTGEIVPIAVVTDNGPAMKSVAAARWFAARAHFTHVRTRHRSPHTNGVIERWFEALKYERLYREDIPDGIDLAEHIAAFTLEYNTIRPHEALHWRRPLDTHLCDPTLKPNPPETEQGT